MPTIKQWGKQDTKCSKCKSPSVKTFETMRDHEMSDSWCIRYFERLCASCLYWSAWIWFNNGETKVVIDANL